MYQGRFLSIVVGVLFVLSLSSHLSAQEDATKKRIAFMRENYDALKAIKRAAEEKDYATIELKAKDIMGRMDKTLDYFPKGSIGEKSRARPEIWDKWDEFSKIPVKVKDVANSLAKAAAAKDEAGVQAQFKALGPEGSPYRAGACYECHKTFFNNPPAVKKADG
jgi:cytochrome c556